MLLFCFAKLESACVLYFFRNKSKTLSLPTTLWFSKGTWLRRYPHGCSGENVMIFYWDAHSDSGTRVNTSTVCRAVMAWLCSFFLCDSLTRPRARTHTLTQLARRVFFRLAYGDGGMSHCRIPHGFAGLALAAHQISFFFHHWLTFCSTPKTLSVTRLLKEELWI